eukprot:664252-Pelagomonas_calceolata.AAC.3
MEEHGQEETVNCASCLMCAVRLVSWVVCGMSHVCWGDEGEPLPLCVVSCITINVKAYISVRSWACLLVRIRALTLQAWTERAFALCIMPLVSIFGRKRYALALSSQQGYVLLHSLMPPLVHWPVHMQLQTDKCVSMRAAGDVAGIRRRSGR